MRGHEVDHVRSDFLRGNDQVSLIFPILVIHQDDALSFLDVANRIFNGIERIGHV